MTVTITTRQLHKVIDACSSGPQKPALQKILWDMAAMVDKSRRDSLIGVVWMIEGAVSWSATMSKRGREWWYKTRDSWEQQFGISRRTVERGDDVLKQIGFDVEERPISATLRAIHYRFSDPERFLSLFARALGVSVRVVLHALVGRVRVLTIETDETYTSIGTKRADRSVQNVRSEVYETHTLKHKTTSYLQSLLKTQEQEEQTTHVVVDDPSDLEKEDLLKSVGVNENVIPSLLEYDIDRIRDVVTVATVKKKSNPAGYSVMALVNRWDISSDLKVKDQSYADTVDDYVPGTYDAFINS